KEVISQTHDTIHHLTYRDVGKRTRRLMSVLKKFGIEKGDKVGTLAWNTHRHLEIYFAAPGIGSVLHTINIRLSPEHIIHIINHAEDKIIFVDEDILPLVNQLHEHLPTVKTYVVMTDKDQLPENNLPNVYSYEELLKEGDETYPSHATSMKMILPVCVIHLLQLVNQRVYFTHTGQLHYTVMH